MLKNWCRRCGTSGDEQVEQSMLGDDGQVERNTLLSAWKKNLFGVFQMPDKWLDG